MKHLPRTAYISLRTVLDVYAAGLALADLQICTIDVNEVPQFLHIDLHEGQFQPKLDVVRRLGDSRED